MTRLNRSNEERRASRGIGRSNTKTPVIVDRSDGSFSTDHMSASVSLMRSWYSISSIAGAYDASSDRGPARVSLLGRIAGVVGVEHLLIGVAVDERPCPRGRDGTTAGRLVLG